MNETSGGGERSPETAGPLRGPRGGLTRVSTYLDETERSAVRSRAFEEERSISDVIRSAVRYYLGLG